MSAFHSFLCKQLVQFSAADTVTKDWMFDELDNDSPDLSIVPAVHSLFFAHRPKHMHLDLSKLVFRNVFEIPREMHLIV